MIRDLVAKPLASLALWALRARPPAPADLPSWASWEIGQPLGTPEEAILYPNAYELIPDVYACVSVIQETVASLPLKFYVGDVEQVREPGNITDLFSKANARDTGNLFMQQVEGSCDIAGNAYLFKDYWGGPRVMELWCLEPSRIHPVPGERLSVSGYSYKTPDGQDKFIPADQVIHIRRYSPDHGLLGMSPLKAAMNRILTQRDSARWIRNVYHNGGATSGFFSAEQILADKDIERIQFEMRRRYGGPENAGKPFLVPKGIKFERLALSMQELQFLEVAKLTSADIYRIYHVPPVIMGTKEGGGLSDAGATADLLLFWQNCIIPRLVLIQSSINEMMLADGEFGPNLTCKFDLSGVVTLQEVFLDQAKRYTEATGGPVLTRAEARERLGLVDLEDPELEVLLLPNRNTNNGAGQDAGGDGLVGTDATPRNAVPAPSNDSAPNTPRTRDRARRKASALIAHHETRAARIARRLYRGWRDRAVAEFERISGGRKRAVDAPGVINVEELMSPSQADAALVASMVRAIVADSGAAAMADVAAAASKDLSFDVRRRRVAEFVARRTHLVLDSASRTTWDKLRDTLAEGVVAQETKQQLLDRILAVFGDRMQVGADTIARTETVSAYNFGNHEAWRQAGPDVVPRRVWVTAQDERVREGHAEAEGTEVGIDEPFMVRGRLGDPFEPLMYPGDPDGSGGNVINCRCVAMPVVAQQPDELERFLMNGHAPAFKSRITKSMLADAGV